jgi:hypothetical protein
MNTPNLPVWTVVGLYPDYRDYDDKVLAATFVAHGYGQTVIEGKWDALSRLCADLPNHLTNPEDFDEDYDPREELIVLAVFPGELYDPGNQHEVAEAFTLRLHRTAELEGLAEAFTGAEADFLAQYEHTTCPYCEEETALITPAGRVVCACWTNPAQELVNDLQGEAPMEGSHA